jgi:hypothetical protein
MGVSGAIGDSNGIQSINPNARSLTDSGATGGINWEQFKLLNNWSMLGGNFEVPSGYAYKHNGNTGQTQTITIEDTNGQTHTLTFSGGILASYTVV